MNAPIPNRRDKEASVKFADRSSPSERSWQIMNELVREAFTHQKDNNKQQDKITRRLLALGWLMLIASFLFALGYVVPIIYQIWSHS